MILLAVGRHIGVVIELFYEAAKCVTSVPMLFVHPLWLILTRTVFLFYWIVIYAYIKTLGLALSVVFIVWGGGVRRNAAKLLNLKLKTSRPAKSCKKAFMLENPREVSEDAMQ